jgi:hypothetical protein
VFLCWTEVDEMKPYDHFFSFFLSCVVDRYEMEKKPGSVNSWCRETQGSLRCHLNIL